jgi:alpha-glucoside transport system permease protein
MTNQILQITLGVAIIPALVLGVIAAGEAAIRRLPIPRQDLYRPWVWMAPMLCVVGLVLAYPLGLTVLFSLQDAKGIRWVGLQNFGWAFSKAMQPVLLNNVLWLTVFPTITTGLALISAILIDRVKYERVARTFLVLPTAISFVAGSVIWRMMYEYQPPLQPQTGTLNALVTLLPGVEPIAWLLDERFNTFALIFVAVWMNLGIATLIISAGVKNISRELIDAARLDGGSEWDLFCHVTVPLLWPTLLVVATTQAIFTLKVFDIVYVMTNGSYGTDVIANKMYAELFVSQNLGHASAIAVLLLVMASPVIIMNIRHARAEA